ncbi:MAG: substrate-binding and VWA domain-containing protein [Pseudonocardiaceae bacterium]
MTDRNSSLAQEYESPRRRGPRGRLRTAVVACAAAGIVLGGIVWSSTGAEENVPCDGATRPLNVSAAPEIAGVVADLVATTFPGNQTSACAPPVVTAIDPAEVADAIAAEQGDRPDVWIADSSVWVNRSSPIGRGLPQNNVSVARSPIVVALPEDVAGQLGQPDVQTLLPAPDVAAGPVQFALADPNRSAPTVGLVLGLQSALADRPDARAILTGVIRAAERTSQRSDQLLASLRQGTARVVPTTEQQVWLRNAQRPRSRASVVYLPEEGYTLDYPYIVLSSEHAQRVRAQRLLDQLTGDIGQQRLQAAGFRDVRGAAGPQLSAVDGIDPARTDVGAVPDTGSIDTAIRALTSIQSGSRLLTVLDVSGSMAALAPGGGGVSKLDVALQVAVNGLALYPDDTEAGLWTFSTNLAPGVDYRELVPVIRLGKNPDGTTGRERLAQALGSIQAVPNGETALYDTALAAVRSLRESWRADSVNSVVLLTDGKDDDPDGITLEMLLATLRAEHDPARPVLLLTIAYGADADTDALTAMSAATGGEMYRAQDPRQIREVVLEAIGRRACRPNC